MTNFIASYLSKVLSVEDNAPVNQEIEHVSYYRLTDLGQLLTAARMIEQEQWEIKVPKTELNKYAASVRVRREERRDGCNREFTLTIKLQIPGKAGRLEVNERINDVTFDAFKSLSSKGMLKLRCTVPVPGTENTWPEGKFDDFDRALCWEIDVFYAEDNKTLFPWVKVDLEVPSQDYLQNLPEFPFSHERAITAPYGQRTEEDEALVSSFYNGPFIYTHEREAMIAASAEKKKEPAENPEGYTATAVTEPTEPTTTDEAGKQDEISS